MLLSLISMSSLFGQELTIAIGTIGSIGPLNWPDGTWYFRGVVLDPSDDLLGSASNELMQTFTSQFPNVDVMPSTDIAAGNKIRWYRKTSPILAGDIAGVEFWDQVCPSGDVCDQAGTSNLALSQVLSWAPVTEGVRLPVELASFEGIGTGDRVQLSWTTLSEVNNAGFEVQSNTGPTSRWVALGFVEGHGTTFKVRTYSYFVDDLAPGRYEFRLKQIDLDGAFEYSSVVEAAVTVPDRFLIEPAYPNPFNPTTTLLFAVAAEQQVEVTLVNSAGQEIRTLYSGTVAANEMQQLTVDAAALPSGTYLVHFEGNGLSATERIVLAK